MRSRRLVLITMLCAASIAACATTEVKAVWKDEAYRSQPKRVLVIAMFKNQTIRRMVEDEFRNSLKSRGTEAATGYEVFPGNEHPSRERVVEQVKAGGFDSLLMTRLIDTWTEHRTVRGSETYAPAPNAVPMRGYYAHGYTSMYSPSYQVEDRFATVETNLYDAATEKLVWTATSDTWMSEKEQKLVKTYVAVMVESLRKQKIIP
jgi:hypothetical protein